MQLTFTKHTCSDHAISTPALVYLFRACIHCTTSLTFLPPAQPASINQSGFWCVKFKLRTSPTDLTVVSLTRVIRTVTDQCSVRLTEPAQPAFNRLQHSTVCGVVWTVCSSHVCLELKWARAFPRIIEAY
jgi:hypothetical protein